VEEVPRSTARYTALGDAAPGRTTPHGARTPGAADPAGPGGRGLRLPYLPGLDGLRALAVAAVLLYHADLAWIPGGFIGVEVFFVISGYLITALLLTQWRVLGRVDLKAFWLARARRLLPALYVLLVVTLAYAVVFLPEEVAGLREEVLAALGYVTNWYLVAGDESYFEAMGRPSLLKHLWSLAVEEQFYLIWPLIFAVGLSFGAVRWRRRRVLVVALAGAAASALLMGVLYRPEVDPSRIYFGTDTRATGLLVGAALAFVWAPWRAALAPARVCSAADRRLRLQRVKQRSRLRRRWGWTAPLFLDLAGIAALGTLAILCLSLGEFEPLLYQGGLAAVALATAVVIMASAHPYTRLGKDVLGWGPLRWVGLRSYGIYLWHWPVFMVSRPQLDVALEGVPLLGLRLAITVGLAELSYRFVEVPVRRGALGRAWRELRQARGFRCWEIGVRLAGTFVPLVAVCAVLGVAVAVARVPEAPSYLSTKRVHMEAPDPASEPSEIVESDASGPGASSPAPDSDVAMDSEAPAGAPEGEKRPRTRGKAAERMDEATGAGPSAGTSTVTAVGDSAMLGAVEALQQEIPDLATIDARGSRQVAETLAVLRQLRASGDLGDVVVVHIGNNGVFTDSQFDEMMRVLKGVRRVLVVNVTVPNGYSWAPNNEVLAEGVQRYPNRAVLVDWHGASAGHPEYFWDGIHLTPDGARAYAEDISDAYEGYGR
jgi:peptidoglycan/LPS O-acetylase OafA/YrhL/lysophospholipase L1-like esterase